MNYGIQLTKDSYVTTIEDKRSEEERKEWLYDSFHDRLGQFTLRWNM